MFLRPALVSLACTLVLGCGTAPDNSDAGEEAGTDAGDVVADAGGQGGVDGGFDPLNPQTWPNAATWGNWQMSGINAQACGMNLASGFNGAGRLEVERKHDFRLTMAQKFNEQTVVLECSLAEGTTGFTCADWEVAMSFNGCVMRGSLRGITGRLERKTSGVEVEIEGTISTGGQGTCPPGCGPRDITAIGSVLAND